MAARPSPPADDETAAARPESRTNLLVMGVAAFLLLAVSLFGGGETPSDASRLPQSARASAAAPPAGQPAGQPTRQPTGQPAAEPLPRSKPLRLLIPKISVDAPFTELSIGRSGQLQPPPAHDVNLVGWYAGGASPGEAGTSIIAGHVDTTTSPAVFANLSELEKGDVFHVRRADGRKASFVVDDLETFDKGNFPDRRVYGDTDQPQVRLITCAGDYDRAAKDYTENLVVFAHLI
jgi:LPXTG-site transpeptidase (sortase) family protein